MDIDWENVLGYAGAANITLFHVPQLIKLYKIKDSSGISNWFILLNVTSSAIWMSYSVIIEKPPMIIANVMYSVFTCCLCGLKYKYRKLAS